MIDLKFKYKKLLKSLKKQTPFETDISIILGSGLGDFADSVKTILSIPTIDLPGYPPSTVEGHSGKIHFAEIDDKKALLFQGRIHFYEGYKISECILPSLISRNLGCKKLLLTNAAGGVNKNFKPGDLMLATSFNGMNIKYELASLLGLPTVEVRNKLLDFPNKSLNEIIIKAADEEDIPLKEGVYWYAKGPSYETPAEIQMINKFGSDAVGMSTVHEAVFAAANGMKVASISCITNLAAGISPTKLTHEEVTETANRVKDTFARLIQRVIKNC
jgi:purine-nucleoside phosphorylase